MGHFGNIRYHYLSSDILAHCKRQLGREITELLALHQLPEGYHGVFLVGNFNADCCFPGNRGFNTNIHSGKIQLDIICES